MCIILYNDTMKRTKMTIPVLLMVLFLLNSYQFLSAQWAPPTATAPGNNTPAPVNVGSAAQTKEGVLGLDSLALFSANPRVQYVDETAGQRDWWTYLDNQVFSFLADRNEDGTWSGESPYPLQMFASTSPSGDWARFGGQVRSNTFCDWLGNNCFAASDVAGIVNGGVSFYPNVGVVRVAGWNSFPSNATTWPGGTSFTPAGLPSGSFGSEYNDVTFTNASYDACFITTNYTHIRDDEQFTGGGGCELTQVNAGTGEWRLRAMAAKRSVTECKASCMSL